jgi:hypothetical protein
MMGVGQWAPYICIILHPCSETQICASKCIRPDRSVITKTHPHFAAIATRPVSVRGDTCFPSLATERLGVLEGMQVGGRSSTDWWWAPGTWICRYQWTQWGYQSFFFLVAGYQDVSRCIKMYQDVSSISVYKIGHEVCWNSMERE